MVTCTQKTSTDRKLLVIILACQYFEIHTSIIAYIGSALDCWFCSMNKKLPSRSGQTIFLSFPSFGFGEKAWFLNKVHYLYLYIHVNDACVQLVEGPLYLNKDQFDKPVARHNGNQLNVCKKMKHFIIIKRSNGRYFHEIELKSINFEPEFLGIYFIAT